MVIEPTNPVWIKYALSNDAKPATTVPDCIKVTSPRDMPGAIELARYRVTKPDGLSREIEVKRRSRQTLELLRQGPVLCAATIRLGYYIDEMRDVLGDGFVHTQWYRNDSGPFPTRFGVYFLCDQVELKSEAA